jgi:hypothetical protein
MSNPNHTHVISDLHCRGCDCDECLPGVPAEMMPVQWRRQVAGVMGHSLKPLKPLWWRALKKRGSLGPFKEINRSQYSVAKQLGVTRTAVAIVERRALKKLRKALGVEL